VIKKSAILVLGVLLLAAACTKKDAASSATPAAAPGAAPAANAVPGTPGAAPAAKPVPAQLPDVVAKVNGEDIRKTELEMAVKTLEERAQQAVPAEQRDTVYRQVLDRIVGFKLLVQEAKSRKLVAPPWEVDSQIDSVKKQFQSDDQFQQMLKSRGITLEQLRTETADSVTVNKMLQAEVEPKLTVTEPEVKKFFDENKPRFRQEDSVHVSHILIRADEKADAATKAKAKAQAEDILKQLKNGTAFADLAKKFSQDPGSAPNGGDLSFFSKGQMVPAFENAAFALQPGQTSAVVQSPFGYHIIKSIETKPGRDLPYEEVRAQIGDYLKQQLRDKKSQEFVESLKAKAKVQILI
jgi:peptidyl-prolyl cis-trans isomerase C